MKSTILIVAGLFCVFAVAQRIHCTSPVRYYVSDFRANWYRATEYCFYMGMQPVIVETAEEHNKVIEVVKDSNVFTNDSFIAWIGASDLGEEGIFVWHATGTRVRYANWRPGQPDNDKNQEDCVTLMNMPAAGWEWHANDEPCWNSHYFICENVDMRTQIGTF
ncbi:C-type lectin 37Db-like [Toxorhynchites rutilus septentrionalis]|uniref:C-type lectin 37Db-like n=1 Tax=Toxorhynchites rutilus septentrionalis TaxID=329112 RepID=UPI002478E0B8|nr:C-type lectin 37Db-like [Toxorhynchites rutilus septentrionalis]